MTSRILSFYLLPILFAVQAHATDRFFDDIEAKSPSGRYHVTAKSPENQKEGDYAAFQANFTYTCTDTQTAKVLWTRKQPMTEPKEDSILDDPFPAEGSPVSIEISDRGDTVIYSDWHDLIVIDITGQKRGEVNILRDGFTKKEREKYVAETTAGPMWSGYSHWYFLEADAKNVYVIRTWWRKRLMLDLSTAKLVRPNHALEQAALKSEKAYVMHVLEQVMAGKAESCESCGSTHQASFAAYLAGVLQVREAIPALRKLESDPSSDSCTIGGWGDSKHGRINPHNYCTLGTRQDVHLALRRLGETPGPFPCTVFDVENEDIDQEKPYVRKVIEGPRHLNAKKLKKGMSPEQVIDLIDGPDYTPGRVWEYDIDAKEPYTLSISWSEERTVEAIKKVSPARWQDGLARDAPW